VSKGSLLYETKHAQGTTTPFQHDSHRKSSLASNVGSQKYDFTYTSGGGTTAGAPTPGSGRAPRRGHQRARGSGNLGHGGDTTAGAPTCFLALGQCMFRLNSGETNAHLKVVMPHTCLKVDLAWDRRRTEHTSLKIDLGTNAHIKVGQPQHRANTQRSTLRCAIDQL
jgi:hypothetical protein